MERGLKPQEVADMHGVSRDTVMRHLRDGRLKGYMVGSQWRVRESVALRMFDEVPLPAEPKPPKPRVVPPEPPASPPVRRRRKPAVKTAAAAADPYADLRRSA
jgi:excisionase family DNA binding protein